MAEAERNSFLPDKDQTIPVTLGKRTEETAAIYFHRSRAPAIRRMLPQKAQTLDEALADFHSAQVPGASSYGRTIWTGGRYVGDVWCFGMAPRGDPEAMVSYCVFEQALWGKGVASEALRLFLAEVRERFGLRRFGAFTYAENAGSVRVLEKNGFHLAERFQEDGVWSVYYVREE